MKALIITLIASLAIVAQAKEYIVGIPRTFTSGDRTNVLDKILTFVLKESSPGDSIRIIDATEQMLVTTFRVPEGAIFEGQPKARMARMQVEMAALIKFVQHAPKPSEQSAGTINLPRFLDYIVQVVNGGKPTVIIIANPFYVDSADEALNSRKTYFSDGHIMAESSASVFSTTQKQKALEGISFHYAHLTNSFLNSLHEQKTKRFWSLYIGSQQGVLATFLADVGLTFQRAKQGIKTPCIQATVDLADTTVEMRSVTQPKSSVASNHTPLLARIDPLEPKVITLPAPPPIVIMKTNTFIKTNVVEVPVPGPTVVVKEYYPVLQPPPAVPAPKPKVTIPWEGKGGEKLIRLSEESRKPQ